MPEVSWLDAVRDPHVPVRVAWSPTLGYASVDSEVLSICNRAIDVLSDLGIEVTEVPEVFAEDPVSSWLTYVNACNWRSLKPFHGTERWASIDPGLAAMAEAGSSLGGAEVISALDDCHRMNLQLVRLFRQQRLLLTPTLAAAPPRCGELGTIDGKADVNWVSFTYPFNCTRSPAATICAGLTSNGLPVGLQLVGPQHGDQVVLRAAAALEAAIGFDSIAPSG